MTRDPFTDAVRDLHKICDYAIDRNITDAKLLDCRLALITEEVKELLEAARAAQANPSAANKAMMLRELADVQYVLAGLAVSFGLPLADGFQRVHEANLSKLVDGKALTDPNGKMIKGPNFCPPVMDDLVA